MITLTTEERDLLSHALWRARNDIWQTARVSEYNLTGKDPSFPDDEPNEIPNPPRQIHRAGVDESYQVVDIVKEASKLLASKRDKDLDEDLAYALYRSDNIHVMGDGCCSESRDVWLLRNIIRPVLAQHET